MCPVVGLLLPDVVCFWEVWLVCWIVVGLLLEVFLFGLMRGCFPKLSIMLCMRAVHAFVHRLLAVGAWFPCFFGW